MTKYSSIETAGLNIPDMTVEQLRILVNLLCTGKTTLDQDAKQRKEVEEAFDLLLGFPLMLTEDQLDNMWAEEDLIDRNDGVSFNDDGNHFKNSKKAKRKHSKTNLPEQANINYQEAIKILTCFIS